MGSDKNVLNVRYDPTVYEKLRLISEQENRSMANLVEYWSLIHIAEYEKSNGPFMINEDGSVTNATEEQRRIMLSVVKDLQKRSQLSPDTQVESYGFPNIGKDVENIRTKKVNRS